MIKQLIHLVFYSTGSTSTDTCSTDDDFFNEPSVLRPQVMSAAAVAKDDAMEFAATPPTSSSHCQVVVTGLFRPGMHYAARSA